MGKKKRRLPAYNSVIGGDTEVSGDIRFVGALHVDGKVTGDITGQAPSECALTLGQTGTIEGDVDVAHVVLNGTVKGDVRAIERAELVSGARIDGKLYYRALQVPEGAEINGEVVHIDDSQIPQPSPPDEEEPIGSKKYPADGEADPADPKTT
ncbi:MAG: polymer-forming cytoskeletal protein [Candidatus Thiosymbion ectosymbiont of Robbea hypermnestra]|nr:polymer-forming cytoskeletal protein [Candidatus Thiosymbion ectosymbiont of Robbea hypermnestra]